ncbi:uncharacterized protein UTRI_10544 [Ustilago trichophora]|uniref:Myb-like domain-containing protein n=1 Tax=Ustilago trichophora TaxID=86804 RepID=A0A5C3ECR9_9BASI|nr:uncharacterized protein UTRI_10544 [Ustilago trichophora]
MDSRLHTPFELNRLPSPVRQSLMSLSESGAVNSMTFPHDYDSVPWPATPARSQTMHVHSSQAPQAAIQETLLSPAPSQLSDRPGNTQPQWDPRSVDILLKSVLANNPNLMRTNADRGRSWTAIVQEFNHMCSQEGLPERRERGIKLKFNRMVEAHKQRNNANTRATGSAEWSSEVCDMLDEYIESETFNLRGRRQHAGPTESEQDREELAHIAGESRQDPATRSMASIRERQTSQSFSQASESDIGDGSDARSRKRPRSTAADAFAAFAEDTIEFRQFEKEIQLKQLGYLQEQVDANRRAADAAKEQAALLQTIVNSQQQMMTTILGLVQGIHGGANNTAPPPPPRAQASVRPTLSTISQESMPHAERYRSASILSDVSTPSRRRSTRSRSQSRTGPFGGFQ